MPKVLYQLLTGQAGPAAERAEWAIAPRAVRVLGLSGLAPKLTDRILRRVRGRTAAPRVD